MSVSISWGTHSAPGEAEGGGAGSGGGAGAATVNETDRTASWLPAVSVE